MSTTARERDDRTLLLTWLGVAVAPFAWFLGLGLNYALVGPVCANDAEWLLHLVSALTLLGALYGVWAALRASRAPLPDDMTSAGRARAQFMTIGGAVLSAFFVLLILLSWVPTILVEGCGSL